MMMGKYCFGIYQRFVWIDGYLPHYGHRLEFILLFISHDLIGHVSLKAETPTFYAVPLTCQYN